MPPGNILVIINLAINFDNSSEIDLVIAVMNTHHKPGPEAEISGTFICAPFFNGRLHRPIGWNNLSSPCVPNKGS